MSLFCIRSQEIDFYWPSFSHHIERFCDSTQESTPEAIRTDLKDARKQLWGWHDGLRISAICLTEVSPPVCWLWGCCGNLSIEVMQSGLERIRSWACSIGCTKLKLRGRLGWERKLAGFRKTGVILEQDL